METEDKGKLTPQVALGLAFPLIIVGVLLFVVLKNLNTKH